jgi:hypothetical protein
LPAASLHPFTSLARTTLRQGTFANGKPHGVGTLALAFPPGLTYGGQFICGRPEVLANKLNFYYALGAGAAQLPGGSCGGSCGGSAALPAGSKRAGGTPISGARGMTSGAGASGGGSAAAAATARPAAEGEGADPNAMSEPAAAALQVVAGHPFPVALMLAAQGEATPLLTAVGQPPLPPLAVETACGAAATRAAATTSRGATPASSSRPSSTPCSSKESHPGAAGAEGGGGGRQAAGSPLPKATRRRGSAGGKAGTAALSAPAAGEATLSVVALGPATDAGEAAATVRAAVGAGYSQVTQQHKPMLERRAYFDPAPSGQQWLTAEGESGRRVLLTLQRHPPQPLAPGRRLSVLLCCVAMRRGQPQAATGSDPAAHATLNSSKAQVAGAIKVELHIFQVGAPLVAACVHRISHGWLQVPHVLPMLQRHAPAPAEPAARLGAPAIALSHPAHRTTYRTCR